MICIAPVQNCYLSDCLELLMVMWCLRQTPPQLGLKLVRLFSRTVKNAIIKRKKRQRDAAVAGYAAIYSGAVSYMSVIKNEYPSCSAS